MSVSYFIFVLLLLDSFHNYYVDCIVQGLLTELCYFTVCIVILQADFISILELSQLDGTGMKYFPNVSINSLIELYGLYLLLSFLCISRVTV